MTSAKTIVFEHLILLIVLVVVCSTLQYFLFDLQHAAGTLKIWRIPSAAPSACVMQVCGGSSILLLFGAPLIGGAAPAAYFLLQRSRIRKLAKEGTFNRFDDPILRMQAVIVALMLFANAFLGGALITELVGSIEYLSILVIQTVVLALSFFSMMLAGFNGLSSMRHP